jgi:tetratricopeptide (TPR) repeat protein
MIAMKMPLLCLVAAFATNAALSQMQHGPVDTSNAGNRAPILDGLGNHAFPVSTKNGTAQKLVNQGLVLNYAFNHAEAHRSFSHAADWDKELAMAYWGQALSLGPHINAAMEDANVPKAWTALQTAMKLASKATPREKALIGALSKRYGPNSVKDRSPLDLAYAEAMREVAKQFPNDSDVLTLAAESLMNLHPWDYWKKDGSAQPWTQEFIDLLEKAMKIDPMNPGALHLYIHTVEASTDPFRGTAAADRLQHLTPAAGHLVHMPGHIYVRTGRYEDAANSNLLAIKADDDYLAQCKRQGIYPLMYAPHNWHFLWFARSFQGKSKEAMAAAKEMASRIDQKLMVQPGMESVQHVFSSPMYGIARFGLWDEALAMPEPAKDALYVRGVWHFARGLAMVRKGDSAGTSKEIAAMESLRADPKFKAIMIDGMCPAERLLGIAEMIVRGEKAAAERKYDIAISSLKQAVAWEDENPYMEPAYWAHPARLVLGAVLLEAGKPAEAEAAYLEDLKNNAENGWALFGLAKAYEAQGKSVEAAKAMARFELAWKGADLSLTSSRK